MGKRAPIKDLPPADRLHELLAYDAKTGVLTWRSARGPLPAGHRAGTVGVRGHRMVRVDWRYCLAHRLIWKMMTGADPRHQVDHIDRNRDNNAWANLREATHGENRVNSRQSANKTGYRGVRYCPLHKKFRAVVSFDKRTHHIGYYPTAEEAFCARQVAAERIQGEFLRAA